MGSLALTRKRAHRCKHSVYARGCYSKPRSARRGSTPTKRLADRFRGGLLNEQCKAFPALAARRRVLRAVRRRVAVRKRGGAGPDARTADVRSRFELAEGAAEVEAGRCFEHRD